MELPRTSGQARRILDREPIPGPPRSRSRRRPGLAGARDPVAALREAEVGGAAPVRDLVVFLADIGGLVADLTIDRRVPWRGKAAAVAGVATGVVVARARGLARALSSMVACLGVRELLRSAGYAVIYERWRGTDEGLAILLGLAGVGDEPVATGARARAGPADSDELGASR